MIDKKLIINQAKKYDVITFDVFDTLIIRDVRIPTDIFTLAYGRFGRYIRVLSEIVARRISKTGEVSLADISKICPFSCEKELEIEKKYCRANPAMIDVYNELVQMGKKIYAISDMYLSSDFISELLKGCGYDMPVTVSCEEKCSKKNGELFTVLLNKYSLSSNSVFHIGDNKESDGIGADKAGIESYIIETHTDLLQYTKYSKGRPELSAFINHGLNEISDPVEQIGYEIVGPIILAFCQWVNLTAKSFGFERLFFLARDMRFTYDIYKYLYDEDVKYLCVSRKSLDFAKEHPDEICKYLIKEGCFNNVSIVDTGWVGNAQVEIEKYSKMIDSSSDVGGLYLGTKLAFKRVPRSKRSKSFLYSSRFGQFKCQLFPPFMETLIGCNEQQVISYENGEPVFDRNETRDHTTILKTGARKFIEDWKLYKSNNAIFGYPVNKPFERLFYHPKNKHIDLLGKLHYEDYKDTSIVSYDDKCNYLVHPRRFVNDLGYSGWKGAFLKKTGLLYPFLMALYFSVGAFRLYLVDINKLKHQIL